VGYEAPFLIFSLFLWNRELGGMALPKF
jgi:hypothetical protein